MRNRQIQSCKLLSLVFGVRSFEHGYEIHSVPESLMQCPNVIEIKARAGAVGIEEVEQNRQLSGGAAELSLCARKICGPNFPLSVLQCQMHK